MASRSLRVCSWQHHLHRTPAVAVASAAVGSSCSLLRCSTRLHSTQHRMCRPVYCASSLRTCTRSAALPFAFPLPCLHALLAARRTYTAKSSSSSTPAFDAERREDSGGSGAEGYVAERDGGGGDGAYVTANPWATTSEEEEEAAAAAARKEGSAAISATTGAESVEPLSTDTTTNVSAEEEHAAESMGDAAVSPRGDHSGMERPAGSDATNDAASSSSPTPSSSTEATGEGSSASTQDEEADTAQGDTADTDAPAADAPSAEAEATRNRDGPWDDGGAGLVHRRVAQWYVPGLERAHRSVTLAAEAAPPPKKKITEVVAEVASIAVKGRGAEKEEVAAAAAAATAPADASSPQAAAAAASTGGEGGRPNPTGDAPSTAAAAAAAETASTSPASAVAVRASTDAAAGVVKAESNDTAKKSSSTSNKPTEAKKGVDTKVEEDEDEEEDEGLPSTLLTVQANRNKRMKRLLMASLGSDFAKAGLSNDGVRTSFSVVNYQTIKQLTGLARIPSALLISCLVAPENRFSWVDISMHPTATLSEYKEALEEVLLGLGMHRTMVEDSAEPMLLPQVTVTKGCYSLLMRYAIDAPTDKQMDSFQDLTNRFTVFVTKTKVITVHRTQCAYVEELKLNWQQFFSGDEMDGTPNTHRDASAYNVSEEATTATNSSIKNNTASSAVPRGLRYLLYYFVKETVGTFTQAIAQCIVEFDHYEANLFSTQRNRSSMARDIYHIKRRASVYGRTLTLTQDAYSHIASALHISSSQVGYQEIMHDLAHVESLAEELNSNADSVLQLLFQLSSYQVNELMRVLTVFSAFFIPLSFIASVYGMNFEDLPMLHNEHGGVFCAVLMIAVASSIFLWFRANKFI